MDKRFEEYDCFGITPEEGLVLDVVRTWNGDGVNGITYPFAMIVDNLSCSMPLIAHPKNMVVFLPVGQRVNSLEHNTYRWLRKAKISIMTHLNESLLYGVRTGDKLKIVCDGLRHDIKKLAQIN